MQPGRLSQAQTAQKHNLILGGLTMKKIIYLGMKNKPHNDSLPPCKAGKLYPVSILDKGYSGHYFELVEVV